MTFENLGKLQRFFKNSKISHEGKYRKPEVGRKKIVLILLLAFSFLSISLLFGSPSFVLAKAKINIVKDKNGHYSLVVDSRPFVIKAVCYNPVPIGKNYSFDFWQQNLEVFKKDAQLMREMGVNAIRIYQPGADIKRTKQIVNYFYEEFGIYTIMGHWLNFWEGAYPDYASKEFRENVKADCLKMVAEFKDSDAVLMWVLGNENNFSFGKEKLRVWSSPGLERIKDPLKRRKKKADIYYRFVNDLARAIKEIDKTHLVALGNGGIDFIDIAGRFSGDLDLLACSIYNGKSFSSTFRRIRTDWKKPFFFAEFGCDSFDAKRKLPAEEIQAQFIKAQWKEIERNLKGGSGEGNCLGGAVFEWSDEWWKVDEYNPSGWSIHDERATWSNGAYYFDIAAEGNLNMNEEWLGIVRLKPKDGVDERIPKQAYYTLKELWKNPS